LRRLAVPGFDVPFNLPEDTPRAELIRLLVSGNTPLDRRCTAAYYLRNSSPPGDAAVLEALVGVSRHPSAQLRSTVLSALGVLAQRAEELGGEPWLWEGVLRVNLEALRDPDLSVCINAAISFSITYWKLARDSERIKNGPRLLADVVDALALAGAAANPMVCLNAIMALSLIGQPASRAEPTLRKLMKSQNPDVRSRAEYALGMIVPRLPLFSTQAPSKASATAAPHAGGSGKFQHVANHPEIDEFCNWLIIFALAGPIFEEIEERGERASKLAVHSKLIKRHEGVKGCSLRNFSNILSGLSVPFAVQLIQIGDSCDNESNDLQIPADEKVERNRRPYTLSPAGKEAWRWARHFVRERYPSAYAAAKGEASEDC
jgi:hypothetical protein